MRPTLADLTDLLRHGRVLFFGSWPLDVPYTLMA
jgi:hypothetical protein